MLIKTIQVKKLYVTHKNRPQSESISGFCDKLAISTYDNVVIMGDINVNTQDHQSQGINKLFEFCDIFGLQNLIESSTCETKTSSTLIDVIVTNRVRSFRHSKKVEIGISDFHKLVMTSFRSTYQRLRPTKIRSYKTFDENAFWADLTCPFHESLKLSDSEQAYENFKQLFLTSQISMLPLILK